VSSIFEDPRIFEVMGTP